MFVALSVLCKIIIILYSMYLNAHYVISAIRGLSI